MAGRQIISSFWKCPELFASIVIMALFVITLPVRFVRSCGHRTTPLHETLGDMRRAIDNYTVDKERAPSSLGDLVSAGYLSNIPVDPITKRVETWAIEIETEGASLNVSPGIANVRSGAEGVDPEGKPYSEY
jgi:general secretion pathway protein G